MAKLGVTSGPPPRAEPLLARGAAVGGVIAGKYRIERVIGHGGMGVVVAASHLQLERTVAIKLIRGDWADDPLAVERLVREAKALASIQSEHVARVLDVGTLADGIPFIVMEYLEGRDLATLLERDGPLPISDAIDFILQACEALAEAHRNGIVHRDIKPANLFVARQPGGVACIKVVDFGISKLINSASVESLTQPSRIVGSLYHMAPEQMRGEAVDARTDVWAIGVLLFELITGRKPFQGAAWPAVCARVLNESAPPLGALGDSVPEELGAALRRCLNRTPQDRFANVAELAVALSPFGSRSGRVSLERIVRLATSTGSLAAESLSPLPPGTRTPAPAPRAAQDTTVDPTSGPLEAHGPSSAGSGTSPLPRADRVVPVLVARELAARQSLAPEPRAGAFASAGSGSVVAPARSRRAVWGAALAGVALLIGLPWLGTRNAARQPKSTQVASVALRPSGPERSATPAPFAEPPPSAEGSAAPPRAAPVTTPNDTVSVPSVVVAALKGGVPAGAAAARADAVQKASDAPPSKATPTASEVAPSTAERASAPEAVHSRDSSPPAQSVAAKPSAEPAAPAGQRGANPWDLRDLEFE